MESINLIRRSAVYYYYFFFTWRTQIRNDKSMWKSCHLVGSHLETLLSFSSLFQILSLLFRSFRRGSKLNCKSPGFFSPRVCLRFRNPILSREKSFFLCCAVKTVLVGTFEFTHKMCKWEEGCYGFGGGK